MVTLQIVEKPGANLRRTLLRAMRQGDLRTFRSERRGRKITHINENYPGWINWDDSHGVISCEIRSPKQRPRQEWKLLSSFIGRLADKYADAVHSIHVQFPEET